MTIEQLKSDCDKALNCLYIAVDETVAGDVNAKVKAYIAALTSTPQIVENPERCWKCKIRPQLNPTVGLCAECNGLTPAEPANADIRRSGSTPEPLNQK